MSEYYNKIIAGAKALNIELEDNQIKLLYSHMEKVLETNKKFNLTAITQMDDFIIKHIIDSLTIVKFIDKPKSIIDIGTGAGYPGLVLKICKPDAEVLLLDSVRKKITFLKEIISELSLNKIDAMHQRAEEAARNPKFREKFDFCTARAVSSLPVLLEYCLPFVKVGGKFIGMKGKEIKEEIQNSNKALKELGGEIEEIKVIKIPGTSYERNIIIVKKARQISAKYPRKAGHPLKRPII